MAAVEALLRGLLLLAAGALAGCERSTEPLVSTTKPENIVIAVDKDGNFYWNDEPVTCAEISAKMTAMAPQPADAPKIDFCETSKLVPQE